MRVGFIGTGILGSAMAAKLIRSGHTLTVFNRTKSKTEPLIALGARGVETPAGAFADSECTILMLSDKAAISDVLSSPGALEAVRERTVIQMGTIAPEESLECSARISAAGGAYLEAPVLGSVGEAEKGTLLIMVGSSAEQLTAFLPLFEDLGSHIEHAGEVGKAALLKLAYNQLIASLRTAFAFSLGLIERGAVDRELFMKLLRVSALHAPMFEKSFTRMIERDYTNATFPVKHLLKDVRLVLDAGKQLAVDGIALEGVARVLAKAVDADGELDSTSLYEAVNPR